uniref:MABP1/WDR62 second WD40 domain-containing protein n=1 Tax=Xenopus tropicalis TaxID=8364 RepID=A0A803KD01_XENTR
MATIESGTTITSRLKNLLRSPSIKLRRHKAGAKKEDIGTKVTLEKVLGITVTAGRGLSCDPKTGLVAYPHTEDVVVIFCSGQLEALLTCLPHLAKFNQQKGLRELLYGGYAPVYKKSNEYTINLVYIKMVDYTVPTFQKNVVVAANKVSSKVTAVSFSEDSSYFVTAGNRHVKFWYLDEAKSSKVNSTIPLLGRSGLLGELRNNFFTDVACGKGKKSNSTFCITSSGLLCEFNDQRLLDKWVELRTTVANCILVNHEYIFCGCADGTVRIFNPNNLHFLSTMPKPHCLGVDIATVTEASRLFSSAADAKYPDTIAMTFDPTNQWLSCVYNDHSLYVWDVKDLKKVGKVYSALYHSSCVWSVEIYPEIKDSNQACLPPNSFITCSSDSTIRLWNMETSNIHGTALHRNILSNDLMKIVLIDDNTQALLDTEYNSAGLGDKVDHQGLDTKVGIRSVCVSPNGQHLASGDRTGTLRVHELQTVTELLKVEAHDSEILCLEYSKPDTGFNLLASASRDRLIHVLDAAKDYSLQQTLDDHSSSITAVKFAANDGKVRMISCGADKSIYFRTADKVGDAAVHFTRTHHIVRKTTLYDMDVDPSLKYAAIGCQDRNIRIFNISSGKQKKLYKGSQSEDGTLIKVQTDPSGLYIATSCSDKNLSIFDFYSGECVATMFGHSEIVTGMKFTNDCKHLISVSGDSCIFIWRLSSEMTINMRQRLAEVRQRGKQVEMSAPHKTPNARRETIAVMSTAPAMSSDSDKEGVEDGSDEDMAGSDKTSSASSSFGRSLSYWEMKRGTNASSERSDCLSKMPRQRVRWSQPAGNIEMTVKSMLDLRQLDSFAPSDDVIGFQPSEGLGMEFVDTDNPRSQAPFGPIGNRSRPRVIRLMSCEETMFKQDVDTPEGKECTIFPETEEDESLDRCSIFEVKGLPLRSYHDNVCQEKHSPDSACSVDYSSRLSSPEHPNEDSESTEPLSVDANSSDLEEQVEAEDLEPNSPLMDGEIPQTPDQEKFLKRHFGNLSTGNFPDGPLLTSERNDFSSISSRFLAKAHRHQSIEPSVPDSEFSPALFQPSQELPTLINGTDHQPKSAIMLDHDFASPQKFNYFQRKRKHLQEYGHIGKGGPFSSLMQIRKTQSVHDLVHEGDKTAANGGVVKMRSQVQTAAEREEKAIRRRTLPSNLIKVENITSGTPHAKDGKSAKGRSYMNPTTSSMAKISRSMSVGENLDIGDNQDTSLSSDGKGNCESETGAVTSLIETEKNRQTAKETVIIKPHLQPVTNCSSTKTFQAKNRAHLTLDIAKPLPDRPLLSFNKGKGQLEMESPRSPANSCKVKNSFTELTCRNENHSSGAVEKISPSEDYGCGKSKDDDVKANSKPNLSQEAAELFSDLLKPIHRGRAFTIGHTPDHHSGLCSEPIRPRSPSLNAAPTQNSASSVSFEQCELIASELQDSLRKALSLYRSVTTADPSTNLERCKIAGLLTETFGMVKRELDFLKEGNGSPGTGEALTPLNDTGSNLTAPSLPEEHTTHRLGDDKTLALLQQYSELLLQAVEKRMDKKL